MGERVDIGGAIKRRLGFRRIAKLRGALNKLTGGRVGLYSTAEHYSSGPRTKVLRYYQYEHSKKIKCAACGWRGAAGEGDHGHFDELFDVRCPSCQNMLLIVGYPTIAETEQAAGRGNEEAIRELRGIRDALG